MTPQTNKAETRDQLYTAFQVWYALDKVLSTKTDAQLVQAIIDDVNDELAALTKPKDKETK